MSNGQESWSQITGVSSEPFAPEVVAELDIRVADLTRRFSEGDPSLVVYTYGELLHSLFGQNNTTEVESPKPTTNEEGEIVWQ